VSAPRDRDGGARSRSTTNAVRRGGWPRPEGFGLAMVVGGTALLGSAAFSILLLLRLADLGGPTLLKPVPPEWVVVRLLVGLPAPLVAAICVLRLPRSRGALTNWMGSTGIALAIQLPFLFPEHTGGGAFIATALAVNVVGFLVARGRRFRALCDRLERPDSDVARPRR
jgi:hypothetical protein